MSNYDPDNSYPQHRFGNESSNSKGALRLMPSLGTRRRYCMHRKPMSMMEKARPVSSPVAQCSQIVGRLSVTLCERALICERHNAGAPSPRADAYSVQGCRHGGSGVSPVKTSRLLTLLNACRLPVCSSARRGPLVRCAADSGSAACSDGVTPATSAPLIAAQQLCLTCITTNKC